MAEPVAPSAAPPPPPPPPPPTALSTPKILASGQRPSANRQHVVSVPAAQPSQRSPFAGVHPETLQHAAASLRKTQYREPLLARESDSNLGGPNKLPHRGHWANFPQHARLEQHSPRATVHAASAGAAQSSPFGVDVQHTHSLNNPYTAAVYNKNNNVTTIPTTHNNNNNSGYSSPNFSYNTYRATQVNSGGNNATVAPTSYDTVNDSSPKNRGYDNNNDGQSIHHVPIRIVPSVNSNFSTPSVYGGYDNNNSSSSNNNNHDSGANPISYNYEINSNIGDNSTRPPTVTTQFSKFSPLHNNNNQNNNYKNFSPREQQFSSSSTSSSYNNSNNNLTKTTTKNFNNNREVINNNNKDDGNDAYDTSTHFKHNTLPIRDPQSYIHSFATKTPAATILSANNKNNNNPTTNCTSATTTRHAPANNFVRQLRDSGLTESQKYSNQFQRSVVPERPNDSDHIYNLRQASEKSLSSAYASVDALINDMEYKMRSGVTDFCKKCGNQIIGDTPGVTALGSTYHVACFTCDVCQKQLAGCSFYNVNGQNLCQVDYMNSLEKCEKCATPITQKILRAMGKAFHPECFSCPCCRKSLDGIPFTVDKDNQAFCLECYHERFSPRCAACLKAIAPVGNETEVARVIAMDRSYHIECYKCEDCGLRLNSKVEGQGCYPLESHLLCKNCNLKRLKNTYQPTLNIA